MAMPAGAEQGVAGTRVRAIYLSAFLALMINRVLARNPGVLFDRSVIEDPDHPSWVWMQLFMVAAFIYAIYATWRLFRHAGYGQPASITNGLIAPLFWPVIMLIQCIVVYLRFRKNQVTSEAAVVATDSKSDQSGPGKQS